MACLLLGGCGLLFGDAAGELRDDGGTKMPAAQGERIPYKLSIEVDGERRATADEKRAAATDPDGESEGVSLGGSPEEGDEARRMPPTVKGREPRRLPPRGTVACRTRCAT